MFPYFNQLIQMKWISSKDCEVLHEPANESLIWIRCAEAGKHLKPAGQRPPRTGCGHLWTIYISEEVRNKLSHIHKHNKTQQRHNKVTGSEGQKDKDYLKTKYLDTLKPNYFHTSNMGCSFEIFYTSCEIHLSSSLLWSSVCVKKGEQE